MKYVAANITIWIENSLHIQWTRIDFCHGNRFVAKSHRRMSATMVCQHLIRFIDFCCSHSLNIFWVSHEILIKSLKNAPNVFFWFKRASTHTHLYSRAIRRQPSASCYFAMNRVKPTKSKHSPAMYQRILIEIVAFKYIFSHTDQKIINSNFSEHFSIFCGFFHRFNDFFIEVKISRFNNTYIEFMLIEMCRWLLTRFLWCENVFIFPGISINCGFL